MTAGVGTPYWTTPKVLEGKRYTEQADIYTFGVVLSELDTCEIPYHDALSADDKKLKTFQLLTEVWHAANMTQKADPQLHKW
ncbi:hypothetical protein BBJ29_003733 [Phytophthora kernoviae]|uniref:Protein kinase domain-containing protein n=1 Tax=Phytophthora kernoviae TaxID=325452 RepID=A0A3F2RKK3_9STRA|nr:hypothetical protein BBP00_00006607 [Phytophthora kernoviae]RLN71780.1 hypothetical protein BBJ29_003733 [Phytophthora kernoviae]